MNQRCPIFVIALAGLWLFTSCAATQRVDTGALPLIDLSATESDADLERLQALIAQFEAGELKESLIRIPAGTSLPVGLFIETPMAHMESTSSRLHIDRDLWFHVKNQRFRISPDGQQWVKLGNTRGMRELFGYKEGRLAIDLRATRATGAGLSITIQADPVE